MVAEIAKSTRSARVQVLQHRGKSFVTGLRWHPLGSVTGHMKEARQYGREHQLDIVAIRRTPAIIQAGFVAHSDSVTKGMYSLAATLAGQLGDSWIAAWQTAPDLDQYALVAVYQGGVISGCDMIGTGAEVRRRVVQQRSRGIQFSHEYLPPEFEMGGHPLDVEDLLQPEKLKREYRLRPLVFGLSKTELVQLSILAALIAVGVIGWAQWQSHQKQIAKEAAFQAEQQRLAELARLQKESGLEQPPQALEHPWAKRPTVEDFLEGCSNVIYQLPLSIQGWQFTSAMCDGTQVLSSYTRSGNSTADKLIQATQGHFSDRPAFFDEGNSATLKSDISLPAAGDEPLEEAIVMLANLSSWLHSFTQTPTLKEMPVVVPVQPAIPGQPAPPPPPPPQWKLFELRYTSGLTPLDSLSSAPCQGLRLREIKTQYQAGHLVWSVIGDLYAK
ncbi:type 4b pilus protein PilO2 [Pseudomonas extremorientalis]|uniref:type 4b pilus protein PilO2 n=1 Tax=Pseudomonas extremorientalis TaxID=169669 RepID=UPI002732DB03|nr:type 4b pilus protein PilO2 [Pseudomonas extremorientalis]WLG57760.1 type 4b pilus protein PilO2 [Pseudomonas extremorientalis]